MLRSRKVIAISALWVLSITASCDGDEPLATMFGSKFRGVYRVTTFTENTAGCSSEGASVLKEDRDHTIVFTGVDVGGPFLRLYGCMDVAECRELQRTGVGAAAFYMEFRQDRGDRLEGGTVTSGLLEGGVCTGAELDLATLTGPAEKVLRMEIRSAAGDHPPDSAGRCTTRDAQQALTGKPCARFQVITATWIEAL